MDEKTRQFELTQSDLLGHVPSELACNQCGGAFCGLRVGRVFDGKPLVMCGRKDGTREVLAVLKPR